MSQKKKYRFFVWPVMTIVLLLAGIIFYSDYVLRARDLFYVPETFQEKATVVSIEPMRRGFKRYVVQFGNPPTQIICDKALFMTSPKEVMVYYDTLSNVRCGDVTNGETLFHLVFLTVTAGLIFFWRQAKRAIIKIYRIFTTRYTKKAGS